MRGSFNQSVKLNKLSEFIYWSPPSPLAIRLQSAPAEINILRDLRVFMIKNRFRNRVMREQLSWFLGKLPISVRWQDNKVSAEGNDISRRWESHGEKGNFLSSSLTDEQVN